MVDFKMLAHRTMVMAAILGFGSATLFVAHEAAGAAVSVGAYVVQR